MKLNRILRISALVLAVLVFAAASPAALSAEEAGGVESFPVIAGVTTNQAGASLLSVNVKGSNLPEPKMLSKNSSELKVLFPGTRLPSLTWSRDYDFPLLEGVDLEQNGEGVLMTLRTTEALRLKTMEGRAPSRVFRFQFEAMDAYNVSRDPLPVRPVPVPRPNDPLASTKPITLELRDVDIRDVFRMFGEMTDMNIIADPSMPSAYVTVSLKKVPLSEAFGYLMRMYDLGYAIMGKTIIVGKKGSLGKTLGKEKTRSFRVAYAEPAKAADLVKKLSGVETVEVDERQRLLYVTATDDILREVQVALQRIDAPGRQVLIQARIVEVSKKGQKSLENIIEAVYDNWSFTSEKEGATLQYGYSNNQTNGTLTGTLQSQALRLFDAQIQPLITSNEGKVIASPSVIALEGKTATIKLIDRYIYTSGQDEADNTITEEEDVGPTLEFTPYIGRENHINLSLSIDTGEVLDVSDFDDDVKFGTSSRSVETELIVRNGEPFVVGGLFKEQDKIQSSRTPLLSDIPLIGELFKYSSTEKDNTEVVMVVVPYILDTPNGGIEYETF